LCQLDKQERIGRIIWQAQDPTYGMDLDAVNVDRHVYRVRDGRSAGTNGRGAASIHLIDWHIQPLSAHKKNTQVKQKSKQKSNEESFISIGLG
jgi:hypothetical protein